MSTKLDPKSLSIIFVDYNLHSQAYCLWDPYSDQNIESVDVHFDEHPKRFNLALFPTLEPVDYCILPFALPSATFPSTNIGSSSSCVPNGGSSSSSYGHVLIPTVAPDASIFSPTMGAQSSAKQSRMNKPQLSYMISTIHMISLVMIFKTLHLPFHLLPLYPFILFLILTPPVHLLFPNSEAYKIYWILHHSLLLRLKPLHHLSLQHR